MYTTAMSPARRCCCCVAAVDIATAWTARVNMLPFVRGRCGLLAVDGAVCRARVTSTSALTRHLGTSTE
jgi:hypothetical protein